MNFLNMFRPEAGQKQANQDAISLRTEENHTVGMDERFLQRIRDYEPNQDVKVGCAAKSQE